MKAALAVTRLAALAQESRLAIFRALVQAGPEGLCVGDIGAELEVAPATLSFHLKELANARLIKPRQASRFIYYAADFGAMNALLGYLTENCCGGEPCDVACAPGARAREKAA
jgi:ArsR family transcriptional regulator